MSTPLNSTPSSPTVISRDIGSLSFRLDGEGLSLAVGSDLYCFDVDEALAMLTFLRSPGVARLISRLWLAEQHAVEVGQDDGDGDDDDNRDKRFAGRKAA